MTGRGLRKTVDAMRQTCTLAFMYHYSQSEFGKCPEMFEQSRMQRGNFTRTKE